MRKKTSQNFKKIAEAIQKENFGYLMGEEGVIREYTPVIKEFSTTYTGEAKKFFENNAGSGKEITLLARGEAEKLKIADMTLGELIGACEDFCKQFISKHGGRIDYIHGDEECVGMAGREDGAGILLPRMEKSELFVSVLKSGPFPKKSFSIGHGPDKRYYLECRRIK